MLSQDIFACARLYRVHGKAVNHPKHIAEHFNDYVTSISKELQKRIPPTKTNFRDYLKNPIAESFFLTRTTPEEISDLIQTLSSNKSTGPNSYPRQSWRKLRMKYLFLSRQSLTIPLKTGYFPTHWNLHEWLQYLKMDLDYPATTTDQSLFYPT